MIPNNILKALGENSLLAMGYSSPNPPVAAVITDIKDNIISTGRTQKIGENHAERDAYEKCGDLSKTPHNIYITLEPCSHWGNTPPCVDLLLENKPKKVILGVKDPNPLVRKRDSLKLLSENSIYVEFSEDIKKIAEEFLSGFLSRITKKKPRIYMKSALSKNGFFKTIEEKNIHLSNFESDNITQFIRQSVDAIIVGPRTVNIDSPLLNFRGVSKIENYKETNNLYFKNVFSLMNNKSIIDFINLRDNQPLRFYCISKKYFPTKTFFDKLKNLDKSKTFFFILENLESDQVTLLKNNTSNKLIFIEKNYSLPDYIFNNFILNSLLVEGGNFLYSQFGSILQDNDRIFELHTQTDIYNGVLPEYNKFSYFIMDSFNLNNDNWIIKGI